MFFWLGIGAVVLSSPWVRGQGGGDPATENRLHQIYKRFNEAPTSPERWDEALSRARDQNYTIQKGDTLWDISETFFGDPLFWPKIWSVNPDIYNPHEILPNGNIQFVPGTSAEPPQMTLAERKPEPESEPEPPKEEESVDLKPDPNKPKGTMSNSDLSGVIIPPPSKPRRPVVSLPPSLPRYIYFRDAVKDAELELAPAATSVGPANVEVPYFVSDSVVSGVGEVVETETGSSVAGEGSIVLIKGDQYQPGQRLLAVKTLGPVAGSEAKGMINRVEGILEVRNVANSFRSIFRAEVVKSYSLVSLGTVVLNENLPVVVPGDGGQMSPANATIMGGQYDPHRQLFGPYSIVFLNAGSSDGIAVGSRLPIYRNPRVRVPDSLITENPAEIGELQVVRVDGGVATGVVMRALDEIRVGDVTSPTVK